MVDDSYADRVLAEVSAGANGLEGETLVAAIRDACGALQKQMAALNAADYGHPPRSARPAWRRWGARPVRRRRPDS